MLKFLYYPKCSTCQKAKKWLDDYQIEDKEFWFGLDRHLPEHEFENKVRDKRGYVLLDDNKPIGLLRYNLFWDNTPFCTMLFVDWNHQRKDCGGFVIDVPGNEQPKELFFIKGILG